MKMKIFFTLVLLINIHSSVFACEQPEAQIISTIVELEMAPIGCVARLKSESTPFFRSNQICPLYLAEVLSEGVFINELNENGKECRLAKGDDLSGIIYRDVSGKIVFE
jgi:hypothetical protein